MKIILLFCFVSISFFLLVLVMFFYLRVVFTGWMINSVSIKYILSDSLFFTFGIISLFGLMVIFMMSLYF